MVPIWDPWHPKGWCINKKSNKSNTNFKKELQTGPSEIFPANLWTCCIPPPQKRNPPKSWSQTNPSKFLGWLCLLTPTRSTLFVADLATVHPLSQVEAPGDSSWSHSVWNLWGQQIFRYPKWRLIFEARDTCSKQSCSDMLGIDDAFLGGVMYAEKLWLVTHLT